MEAAGCSRMHMGAAGCSRKVMQGEADEDMRLMLHGEPALAAHDLITDGATRRSGLVLFLNDATSLIRPEKDDFLNTQDAKFTASKYPRQSNDKLISDNDNMKQIIDVL
jgi:hypothetical protein